MIYGIGRNYAAHAKELGNAVPRGQPIVFFKPSAALAPAGTVIALPSFSTNVHFECELALRLGPDLEISEFTVALDLTARDKQKEAQDTKAPWGLAKGFKQSCPIGTWVSAKGVNLDNLELKLNLDGEPKQHGFTKDMIFKTQDLVKFLIQNFPVEAGDVILTGTPEGVGPVVSGQRIEAEIVKHCQAAWAFR
jgi:2-keto-4-pentenoate hydratase/2-oxohepta-3-ene-1,7-dioic acid hydratase in catechol pathway